MASADSPTDKKDSSTLDTSSYEENRALITLALDEKINNNYNVPLRNFESFLAEQYNYKTASKMDITNVINQETKQTWALPDDIFGKLMHHIEECRKIRGAALHMSEKQQTDKILSSGIMLDFDCKYRICDPEIKKTTKSKLVEAIMEIIIELLILRLQRGPFPRMLKQLRLGS